jgi:hypothetical protein
MAVSLTGSIADRTLVEKGKRVRERVYLVGAPFLALCDYLMHRSLFFTKTTYESRVSEKTRKAFIKMSWETHCTPAARPDLAECWKNYITYRASHQLHAEGLPVGSTRNDESDPEEQIDRMQTAAAQQARHASASAAAGASAAAAADLDGGQPAASASAPAGEVNGGNAAGQGAGGAAGLG